MLPSVALRLTRLGAQSSQYSVRRAHQVPLAVFGRNYHEKVIDHYERPRNVGSLDKNDKTVGTGVVGAPACGDVMKIQIKVQDGKISEVKFKTFGCGSAIASSSYVTELIKDMTLEEASRITNADIAKYLSLPPVKLHCSMLAQDAVQAAINDYRSKNPELKASTDSTNTSSHTQSTSTNTTSTTV